MNKQNCIGCHNCEYLGKTTMECLRCLNHSKWEEKDTLIYETSGNSVPSNSLEVKMMDDKVNRMVKQESYEKGFNDAINYIEEKLPTMVAEMTKRFSIDLHKLTARIDSDYMEANVINANLKNYPGRPVTVEKVLIKKYVITLAMLPINKEVFILPSTKKKYNEINHLAEQFEMVLAREGINKTWNKTAEELAIELAGIALGG